MVDFSRRVCSKFLRPHPRTRTYTPDLQRCKPIRWRVAQLSRRVSTEEVVRGGTPVKSSHQPFRNPRINIDLRTAAAYIRKQGGTLSQELSAEACELWRIAVSRNITILSPVWLSTKDNVMTDFLSRHSLRQWECQLSRQTFLTILATFQVTPTLDCFASRNTRLLPRYMTWFPDQEAVARDAMIHQWDPISYLFPPVPLIMKTLQKVKGDQIQAVLIILEWPSACGGQSCKICCWSH